MKRKGFALIYTVVVAMLILSSIVALSIKLVPEKTITVSRVNSNRADTIAEQGLSQVMFDLRSFVNNSYTVESGNNHYLPISSGYDASSGLNLVGLSDLLGKTSGVYTYPEKIISSSNGYTSDYQAKIKVVSNTNNVMLADVYVLGYLKDKQNNILSRSVVMSSFNVNYDVSVTVGNSSIFNYVLFSGSDISTAGNATFTGNVFADGSITMVGNSKITGDAYAHGTITLSGGAKVTGVKKSGVQEIPFPNINTAYYRGLADAFRAGTAPYNGTAGFPNTSDPLVNNVIKSYLGSPGSNESLTNILRFCSDLATKGGAFNSLTTAQWDNIKSNAQNIVYYSTDMLQATSDFLFVGVLVLNNSFGGCQFAGSSNIGNTTDSSLSALLVNGPIQIAGSPCIYCNFYTNGNTQIAGSPIIYGSFASKYMIQGAGTGTFKASKSSVLSVSGPTVGGGYSVVSVAGSSTSDPNALYIWRQVSYDEFVNLR